MTCQESLALYSEYLDGALPPEVRERFEVHLARCDSCAHYHRVLRKGLRLVHEMPELEPSSDFQDRLQHRIFHLMDERIEPRRRGRAGTVASIAALGMIAFAVWQPATEDTPAFGTTPAAEMLEIRTSHDPGVQAGWLVGSSAGYMNPAAQPSISLAFPGPYSPLIVEPPLRGGGRVRFTSLLE
jgi:anti-sigma factor RsiW